jgi:hypothetical protein
VNISINSNETFSAELDTVEAIATAAGALYTPERKEALLSNADLNRLGEPVRYYRLMGPGEVIMLLHDETVTPLTSPTIKEDFAYNRDWLLESLAYRRDKMSPEFQSKLAEIMEALGDTPTLEQFMNVSLHMIPRYDLFKFHVKQMQRLNNYYGIMSVSAGVPFVEPSGFKRVNDSITGSAVVEFVIPSDAVLVHPPSGGLRETEKEVNVLEIKPEWVLDMYLTSEDFASRFVASTSGPLKQEYAALMERDPMSWIPNHVHDMLMAYKDVHPLEDLIPLAKIQETDVSNPRLKKPILLQSIICVKKKLLNHPIFFYRHPSLTKYQG